MPPSSNAFDLGNKELWDLFMSPLQGEGDNSIWPLDEEETNPRPNPCHRYVTLINNISKWLVALVDGFDDDQTFKRFTERLADRISIFGLYADHPYRRFTGADRSSLLHNLLPACCVLRNAVLASFKSLGEPELTSRMLNKIQSCMDSRQRKLSVTHRHLLELCSSAEDFAVENGQFADGQCEKADDLLKEFAKRWLNLAVFCMSLAHGGCGLPRRPLAHGY